MLAMNDLFNVFGSLLLLAQQHADSPSAPFSFAPGAVGALMISLLLNRAKTQHPRRSSAEDRNRDEQEHEINVGIECYNRGEYDQAKSLLGPAIRKAEKIAPCSTDAARAYRVAGGTEPCRRLLRQS